MPKPGAQVYKDSNHKPEMAIALTGFEALCGFVEHAELVHALQTVPELQSVVGQVRLRQLQQPSEGLPKEILLQGSTVVVPCQGCQGGLAVWVWQWAKGCEDEGSSCLRWIWHAGAAHLPAGTYRVHIQHDLCGHWAQSSCVKAPGKTGMDCRVC